MNDSAERKILEIMNDRLVARKSEIAQILNGEYKDTKRVVDQVTKSLVEKGWIRPIYAVESTFAITQKGMIQV